MQKYLSIAAVLGCLSTSSTPAMATTMVELTTHQKVDASEAIVRGVITEIWTEEDHKGIIWTRAQVEVSQTLKGDASKKAYVIDQMGGDFGANMTLVANTAQFSVGEDAIFFLETLGNGRTTTVGLSQGKLTTRLDPYSQELIVQRFLAPVRQQYDHRFLPLPPENEKVFLADFIDTIETRLDQGWDGKAIPGASIQRLQKINATEVTR